MQDNDFLTWTSRYDAPKTSEKIQSVLNEAGVTIFAVIDQQHHARLAGLSMDPLIEILFGNPRAGTPLMQANPLSAFDLPVKVLVGAKDEGPTLVSMLSPETFVQRYGDVEAVNVAVGGAAKLIGRAMAELG
jgi:uncharacterized protein (DUF302 family)